MEVRFRIWLEEGGEHVIGKGGARILRAIKEEGSLTAASRKLGMSYRYIWQYLKNIERAVGKVVETERGGKGGGGARLTDLGERILEIYERYESVIEAISSGDVLVEETESGYVFLIPKKFFESSKCYSGSSKKPEDDSRGKVED